MCVSMKSLINLPPLPSSKLTLSIDRLLPESI
jgi:hypothetical protein